MVTAILNKNMFINLKKYINLIFVSFYGFYGKSASKSWTQE